MRKVKGHKRVRKGKLSMVKLHTRAGGRKGRKGRRVRRAKKA